MGPNAKLRLSGGRMTTKAGAAYDHGTALAGDFKFRPGGDPSTRVLLGGSAVWQRRDRVLGGNVSTEFKLPKSGGRGGKGETLCSVGAQCNNKGNGQLTVRLNSHDHPELAAAMLVPLLKAVWDKVTGRDEF